MMKAESSRLIPRKFTANLAFKRGKPERYLLASTEDPIGLASHVVVSLCVQLIT